MSFSEKLWALINKLGIKNEVYDTLDKHEERGVVLYKTDWSTNKIESLVQYLKRQMRSSKAKELVDELEDLWYPFDNDYKILFWLRWVVNNIVYTSDQEKFGIAEKWEDIDNVLETREADCESGASLLYVLCRLSGVPALQIRLYGGDVKTSSGIRGHLWMQTRCDADGIWKLIDWCYYVRDLPLAERASAYDDRRYVNRWWGFNEIKHFRGWK